MSLKFHKIYSKKHVPTACNSKKRLCYRCFNLVKLLRAPFLIEYLWWLLLVFSFKLSSLHFILKWQDCKNFTELVPSDFFLGFTKLNPKAVARMCSLKRLFLEISENLQKSICARVLYYIDTNWYHFVKEYLEQFSKFRQTDRQTYFGSFTRLQTHFGSPKPSGEY